MNAIHGVNRRDQILLGYLIVIHRRPELGLLRVELRQLAPVMTLDVLIGVAAERFEIRLLRRLLRDADHAADRAERMMAQL